MILVKLLGGLGNQMFQYSAAKALSLKHQVELKVDTSFFDVDPQGKYTARKFELDVFKAEIKIASQDEIIFFIEKSNRSFPKFLYNLFSYRSDFFYANERQKNFNADFFNYPKNTYLNGYWQNEKYFKDYKQEIINDFNIKPNLPNQLTSLLNQIQLTQSVSIHIRRGDYVTLKSANNFHGICDINYYINAVDLILSMKEDIELFVFSDDIQWCKKHLNFKKPTYFVEHNLESFWDLYLMSNCKHNIIANSSFSWWGAWLNVNTNKKVVAPKHWFNNVESQVIDIIPTDWSIL